MHNPFCKTFLRLRQLPEVEDKSGPQCGGDCGRQEEPAVDRTDILREDINQQSIFNGNGHYLDPPASNGNFHPLILSRLMASLRTVQVGFIGRQDGEDSAQD